MKNENHELIALGMFLLAITLMCIFGSSCGGPEEKTPPAPKPTIFKSQGACWFGIMKTQDAGSGYRWCELTYECKHTEKCP